VLPSAAGADFRIAFGTMRGYDRRDSMAEDHEATPLPAQEDRR
jgi:hypothetical protein